MSFIIWMTGLPCSGKTTISKKLSEQIFNLAILDGDEMRELLSPNEDFSRNGIISHNKKVVNIAKLLLEHNVPVLRTIGVVFSDEEKKYQIILDKKIQNHNARQIIDKKEFIEYLL